MYTFVPVAHGMQKRVSDPLTLELAMDGHEASRGCWEPNSGTVQEQEVI